MVFCIIRSTMLAQTKKGNTTISKTSHQAMLMASGKALQTVWNGIPIMLVNCGWLSERNKRYRAKIFFLFWQVRCCARLSLWRALDSVWFFFLKRPRKCSFGRPIPTGRSRAISYPLCLTMLVHGISFCSSLKKNLNLLSAGDEVERMNFVKCSVREMPVVTLFFPSVALFK